jgi:hypothetical protein
VVLRTVPRQVVRRPARSVPSWVVPWERLQARSEGFLEFHRLLLQVRARPQVLAAHLRDQQIPRKKGKGQTDRGTCGTEPYA